MLFKAFYSIYCHIFVANLKKGFDDHGNNNNNNENDNNNAQNVTSSKYTK